jgi:hypothetical protein
MQTIRRARLLGLAALGLSVGMLTGCQTWYGGMTLPSPHYLDAGHVPQYFPAEPEFPLTRELAYQEEAAGLLNPRDGGPVQNPPPVPGVGPAKGGPAAPPVPMPPR